MKSIGGLDNLKPSGRFKSSRKLKSLVRRGIPNAYRGKIWLQLTLATRKRLEKEKEAGQDNYYKTLLQNVEFLEQKTIDEIEKDVGRTFPEHIYFQDEVGQGCLRRILQV